MYLGQEIKQILPGNVAVGGANMGMVPLFSVQWCPSRDAIWAGYVAADGQELDDNLFPDAAAGIAANNVPTTSNANWLADPTARGAYVAGSSAGKFRVPDYNGKFAGSLGAVFLRGDGTLSAAISGVIQQDEFRSHFHDVTNVDSNGSNPDLWTYGDPGGGTPRTGVRTNPTGGAETRPLNVTGCWVIKLFGAVTNMASADAAQLASSYASLGARIGQLELTERLPLGFGQTWQNVTASRSINTTYTNTTGRPIMVSARSSVDDGYSMLTVGGVVLAISGNTIGTGNNQHTVCAIVPNGATYLYNGSAISLWAELR